MDNNDDSNDNSNNRNNEKKTNNNNDNKNCGSKKSCRYKQERTLLPYIEISAIYNIMSESHTHTNAYTLTQ